jgi:hypothetical protein
MGVGTRGMYNEGGILIWGTREGVFASADPEKLFSSKFVVPEGN